MTTPVQADALNAATTFTFDDVRYTVPPSQDWDLDALEAFEDEKVLRFLKSVLGVDQWARFRAVPRKAADLEAFCSALLEATGLGN